VNKIE